MIFQPRSGSVRPLSLLLSWIIAACSPRASSQEPPVSARFSVEATVGAGGALSLAELGDGGLAVGTTRGVAVFDGAAQRWFTAAPAWVRSVSAGGGRVAFGANDGAVGVLDGRTGASIRSFSLAKGAMVALSPDGARLALSEGQGVSIYEVATGEKLRELGAFPWVITGLAWSPDGAALAAADGRGTVAVLRGEVETRLVGASTPSTELAWSPDGRLLAVGGRPLTIWDAGTGAVLRQITPEVGRAERLAFSPDGAVLAGARDKGQVDLWTVADGALQRTLTAVTSEVPDLAWATPDRLWLGFGAVNAVNPTLGDRGLVLPLIMTASSISAAGGALALASSDAVAVWQADSLGALGGLAAATGPLRLLGGAEGRLWLAEAGGLRAFDPASGALSRALDLSALGQAALRPDGGALAGAIYGADKNWAIAVWDLKTGQERWRATAGRGLPTQVGWSADGALVGAQLGEVVQIYDAGTGRERGRREQLMNNRSGMAISPGAPLVASVGLDRQLELWDPLTGKTSRRLGRLGGSGGWLLAWSPDGEKLAASAKDKAGDLVYVSDRAGGLGGVLAGTPPGSVVQGLAWSPDHALLAGAVGTQPNQGLVLVWSASGGLVHTQTITTGSPNALAWSADGNRLFAALGDGSALVLKRSP